MKLLWDGQRDDIREIKSDRQKEMLHAATACLLQSPSSWSDTLWPGLEIKGAIIYFFKYCYTQLFERTLCHVKVGTQTTCLANTSAISLWGDNIFSCNKERFEKLNIAVSTLNIHLIYTVFVYLMQAVYIHFVIPFATAEPPTMHYVLFSILTGKQKMTFGFNFDTRHKNFFAVN